MALFQIRRGSSSSKGTLAYGEPYLNSDSQSVLFGVDGNEEITLVKLNKGASSDSRWSGAYANSGSLSLTGDITASNAYFRGDVYISGSIQLGDNAVQDTITVIADFNSNLVPSSNNQYTLGSGGRVWNTLYATTASITYVPTFGNIVDFSSSLDSRINAQNLSSLNAYTASNDLHITALHIATSSLNSYSASNDSKISAIHTATSSINLFTSSINNTIKSKMDAEGVISGSSQITFSSTTGYTTYSSSVATTTSASNARISRLETESGSIRTYTSSMNTYTASTDAKLTAIHTSTSSLNTFSSSVLAGLEFTGSNVTIKGNFLVKGTSTIVNSTTIEAGDNIIALNGTGASNGGLVVRDATGASLISGSLLWDTTNDYWIAGKLGSEEKIILNTEFNTLSSSAHNRISTLETERTNIQTYTASINSYTASNDGKITAIHTATASLNLFTSSINSTIKSKLNSDGIVSGSSQVDITSTTGYDTFSSSIAAINSAEETRISNLENVSGTFFAYTSSNNTTNSTQNSRIALLEISTGSINSFTSSANSRLNSLETASGSIRTDFNTHTSSYIAASSSFNTRVGALETFSSSLNASYVSETEFGVWSGSIHSFTSSVNNTTGSQNSRLNALEITTSSLNIATASLFTSASQITSSLSAISQSFNYRINQFVAGTGFIDAFTFEGYTSSLDAYTGSIENRLTAIHIATSSLNSFTSSQNSKNTSLFTATASLNTYTASNDVNISAIHIATSSLNSYTSSLKSAIELTGSAVTIKGDLLVKGTTSTINSTTIQIDDNIISLNAAGTANGGIIVRDALGGSTTSGSLLWDVTNDYWKAGINGSEQKIVLEGVLNSYTASNDGKVNAIHTATASLNTSTASLNSYTASNNINITAIHISTASLNTSTASLNLFSASVNTTTSSQNSRLVSLENKTGSYATTGSNSFLGTQNITGSLVISQNLTVLGSSSLVYVTSSQLSVSSSFISVNVFEPAERFGGLKVYDSGSSNATASIAWDSLNNRWIYQNVDGASYHGAMFIAGPRNTGSMGDELTLTNQRIPKSIGGDHIGDSIIFEYTSSNSIGISGSLSVTGSIVASGTTLVSGSSQIDATATTNWSSGVKTQLNNNTVISGSSQVSGITNTQLVNSSITIAGATTALGSSVSAATIGNAIGAFSGSSQVDLTATSNYASGILSRLNAVGVVSGSSQIDATLTTNWSSGIKTQLNNNTVVSGSSQIAIASTTGFGTYINQNVLTTSNVQFNSLGVGMAASATAGRIDATNDVVAYSSSDRRFKENIIQIGTPIEKIKKIGGYEYDWIPNIEHGYEGHDVGVIAQEIEAVIPELVQTRESGYKAVKYDKLVALLIEGIKEQQNTIEKLEARINKLEGGE
jgi:hypothetical protein